MGAVGAMSLPPVATGMDPSNLILKYMEGLAKFQNKLSETWLAHYVRKRLLVTEQSMCLVGPCPAQDMKNKYNAIPSDLKLEAHEQRLG